MSVCVAIEDTHNNLNKNEEYLLSVDNGASLVEARNTFSTFGLAVDRCTMQQAVDWAVRKKERAEYAVFVNAHSINTAFKTPSLTNNIRSASRVFADGTGLRWAAKKQGVDTLDNVNGTDMLPKLCERAQAENLSLFLLGAAPGVADTAADRLKEQYPWLKIAGTQSGFFDREGAENDNVIERVNQSGADILLVAFGSPIQEAWLAKNIDKLAVSSALAVGGLLDFASGKIPRAPVWLRNIGSEWLWRLLQEPVGKFRRYVIGNPQFLYNLHSGRTLDIDVADNDGFWASSGLSNYLQRAAAVFALLCLSPLLLTVMAIVKFTSDGPIFYHQIRVGQYGRRFKFYKFRSMFLESDPRFVAPREEDSDREGVCKKYVNDPRITSIGRFIRKYSIDELPQLWNVVTGDMMLVGPRPALVEEVEAYEHPMYRRFDVQPGLTGLWQVSGRADTTFEEQISLDLSYVEKRNWSQDIAILLRTVPAVLLARGAY